MLRRFEERGMEKIAGQSSFQNIRMHDIKEARRRERGFPRILQVWPILSRKRVILSQRKIRLLGVVCKA